MQKSPMKIVELCVCILIIISAVIWLLMGGRLYSPPTRPPISTQTEVPDKTPAAPPAIIPRSEVFPE